MVICRPKSHQKTRSGQPEARPAISVGFCPTAEVSGFGHQLVNDIVFVHYSIYVVHI